MSQKFLRSSNPAICLSIAGGEHPRTAASSRRKALFLPKLEMTVVGAPMLNIRNRFFAGALAAFATSAAGAETSSVVVQGADVRAPLEIQDLDYPVESLIDNEEGTVKLAFTLDSAGHPAGMRIMASGVSRLDQQAAQIAATRWVFAPGAASDIVQVTVNWKLPLESIDEYNVKLPTLQVAAPRAQATSHAVTATDYPPQSLRRGETGIVGVRYTIKSDGTVGETEIAQSSGIRVLDEAALRMVTQRWRFQTGATDEVHSTTVAFQMIPNTSKQRCYPSPIAAEEQVQVTALQISPSVGKSALFPRIIDRWLFVNGRGAVSDVLLRMKNGLMRPSASLLNTLKGTSYPRTTDSGCWYYDPLVLTVPNGGTR